MNNDDARLGRREALKWISVAVATFPALEWNAFSAVGTRGRTLTDPDLLEPVVPWDRTLTRQELRTLAALCDVIIPADGQSPSASKVKVPDFIDEWVSAPYPTQQEDKKQIRDGLVWIDAESQKRFQKRFADLNDKQKTAICDDICFVRKARAEFKTAAAFFAKMRDLTSSGFYTTKEGMKDLKYIGNLALAEFKGPPPEVLKYLRLA
jgi:hypothetical protein